MNKKPVGKMIFKNGNDNLFEYTTASGEAFVVCVKIVYGFWISERFNGERTNDYHTSEQLLDKRTI